MQVKCFQACDWSVASNPAHSLVETVYSHTSKGEEGIVFYISGYIAKSILRNTKCIDCHRAVYFLFYSRYPNAIVSYDRGGSTSTLSTLSTSQRNRESGQSGQN